MHFLEPAHLELRPVGSGVGGEEAVQRRAGPTLPAQPGQQAADLAVPLRAGFRLPRQFDGGENGLEDGGRDVVVAEDGGQQVQQLCPCHLSIFLHQIKLKQILVPPSIITDQQRLDHHDLEQSYL